MTISVLALAIAVWQAHGGGMAGRRSV